MPKAAPRKGKGRANSAIPALKKVVWGTLFLKTFLLLLMAWASTRFPFHVLNWEGNFHFPPGSSPGPWGFLGTWDAQHYLFLADQGYESDHITGAFYPLFPFLIRAFDLVFPGGPLFAGILLSTVFTLLAMAYLFRFVEGNHGAQAALLTCLWVLCQPTGFYLGLVYTESLFLLLSAAFFFHWERREVGPTFLAAALLPLCRPTGILVLVPLAVSFLFSRKERSRDWVVGLGALGGFVAYLLVMKASCGSFWAGFAAQDLFKTGHLTVLSVDPWEWWTRNFDPSSITLLGYRTGLLDRLAFLAFFLALPWMWRSLSRPLFFYALALGVASALSLDLVSYARYLGAIFPFFLVLALRWGGKSVWVAVLFLLLQLFLSARHALNYWVA